MSSARQERLWLLERLGAEPQALQLAVAAVFSGRSDAGRLAAAFDRAVERHPMVRARFSDGSRVSMELDGELPTLEVVDAGSSDLGAAVQSWVSALKLRMQQGDLLRAALFQGASETALVVGAHRAIADSFSLEQLLVEVIEPSRAGASESSELVESFLLEPIPELKQRALAAVRRQVSELTEPAELTGDRPRPAVQDQRARSSVFVLATAAVEAARALAGALGASEEAVYLSAFSLLVARYTRRREFLLGRHVASDREERPFGPFDNEVVFRASLGAVHELSVQSFVEAVEHELSLCREFEEVPFESVLAELSLPRDASRAPVFQLSFGFAARPRLPGGWKALNLARTGSAMDLAVNIITSKGENGELEANLVVSESEGLFNDPERATRLASHLEVLLLKMAGDPQRPIDALPLLSEQEKKLLTHGMNPGAVFLSEDTIADRVERAAKAHPDALAVVCGDERISYRELELKATRLARKLRELGVGRDDRVGVCLERSTRLIVALYAILKAGAAYLPVEPSQPRERAEFVLQDAEPKVVLVEGDGLQGSSVALLNLDEIEQELGSVSAEPLEPLAAPATESPADALAYVIYTSGSTGRPKGCLVNNRHVIRLFDATHDWFAFNERDVWTMFHSVAFDFSVWEIWGALLYGGRLVVVPYPMSRSPDEFRNLVASEGVTILNQTPSAFRQFIEADARSSSGPLSLRTVIFGGEALELESLRPWFQHHGDKRPRLVNMYGITETTVHVTYRPISWADLDASYASVIGVPIPDLRCYVVDEALNLVPIGVPGELLVAGAGVSNGYFRRPELNAERFLEDTFSPLPGGLLYRSGDLVRRLPNGELDYLGRIDQQVKIRGFRIETAEVEAALRRSGLVRDAHVLAAKRAATETVLVAYVVTDSTPHELRLSARSALPEYMIPSVFVPVPAIPMTGNGKVDRRALPDPWTLTAQDSDEQYIAPRGRFEEAVALAFAAGLRRSRVSAGCHFFDEGGTSLEAVTVAQHIAELLSVDVPVIKLFEHTTVEALARYLEYEQVVVSKRAPQKSSRPRASAAEEAIAIIGMSGRFPGAASVDALWQGLLEGKESIRFFEPGSLDPALDAALVSHPDYVSARGVLDDPAGFDAAFFGMPPREAEVTDPQQRLGLELAWEALESGGYDPARFNGAIGVYCGEYNVSYYTEHVLRRPDVVESVGTLQAMLGNEKDFIATRIAYKLDLRGPALSIHTGCSTSLVAVAQAFYALRTGQCDMAL
ncbi:MAG TPA: amino acid adenylation domain-containing protein, partial [Polyangiaceae bacterium]|nr:amino acid adenylation domain-containing protein [Polyangiaceae bacterium]